MRTTHRRYALALALSSAVFASGCSGAGSATASPTGDPAATTQMTTGVATTAVGATERSTAAAGTGGASTTAASGAGALLDVPVAAAALGLDPSAPPAGLTAEAVALRSTMLLLVDPNVPYATKAPFIESSDRFTRPEAAYREVVRALLGQIVLTEPTIVISGTHATMDFAAQGPPIGTLPYHVEADLVGGRWVLTLASLCDVVTVSDIPCE